MGKSWNKSANWSLNEHICVQGHKKRAYFSSWVACKPHLSQVPSWCSQLLVSTCSAWQCNLKRAHYSSGRQCGYITLYPRAIAPLRERSYELTCNWALGAMIAGHPTSCLLWVISHNPTCSRKGCWSVSPLILVVFCCGPQGEALGLLELGITRRPPVKSTDC